jgi:hypothetical protein
MEEHLLIWEPIEGNPFCRRNNELHLDKFSFEQNLVLVFHDVKKNEMYTFEYKAIEGKPSFITLRIADEFKRGDINKLINDFHEKEEAKSLNYSPTFYKVQHSTFLEWQDLNDPIREILQPNTEHHLYITSVFYIDVLTEIQPTVSKLKL